MGKGAVPVARRIHPSSASNGHETSSTLQTRRPFGGHRGKSWSGTGSILPGLDRVRKRYVRVARCGVIQLNHQPAGNGIFVAPGDDPNGPYPVFVGDRIIDGEDWIAKRLGYLRERLAEDLTDDQRKAVEGEIELLSREVGLTVGGRPNFWFFRRFARRWRNER